MLFSDDMSWPGACLNFEFRWMFVDKTGSPVFEWFLIGRLFINMVLQFSSPMAGLFGKTCPRLRVRNFSFEQWPSDRLSLDHLILFLVYVKRGLLNWLLIVLKISSRFNNEDYISSILRRIPINRVAWSYKLIFLGSSIVGGSWPYRFCWSVINAKSNLHEKIKTNDMDDASYKYQFYVCSFISYHFDPYRQSVKYIADISTTKADISRYNWAFIRCLSDIRTLISTDWKQSRLTCKYSMFWLYVCSGVSIISNAVLTLG